MKRNRLPAIILGGDPFSHQFRYLYRKDRWWKLHDEDYCLSIMRSAYEEGCRAYDLSFIENVHLFKRLSNEVSEPLTGFGNPTWDQGVMFDGRFIFYIRDRIIRTLVEQLWPRPISKLVEEKLAQEDVLVFGYDKEAPLLTDDDIAKIYLDEDVFRKRLSIFKGACQYVYFGGSDADYLVSLGRMDILRKMLSIVASEGFIGFLLCQYPSLVLPQVEKAGWGVGGYVVPINKVWSWFDHESSLQAVKSIEKPVIAFMALSSPELRKDVRGALRWLYEKAGVESVLFGTATPEHARVTTRIAIDIHKELDVN